MATYNISINNELDMIIKSEMKKGRYANRSEFFRDLIRERYVHPYNDIEVIDEHEPDFARIEKRKKTATFASADDFKRSF